MSRLIKMYVMRTIVFVYCVRSNGISLCTAIDSIKTIINLSFFVNKT